MDHFNLLIITPFLPPAVGGGGVYTELLVEGLLAKTETSKIVILTESYPGHPVEEVLHNGRLCVKRLFPYRAGVVNKERLRYLKYAYQNLQFFLAYFIAQHYKITHVLVHSSFHNNPSLMSFAVKALKVKMPQVQLISDVRDPKLPPQKLHSLYIYNKIVCCSENVYEHLTQDHKLREKVILVPVIINTKFPSLDKVNDCKYKYGLLNKKYIINNSGISKEKGIDLLLEVVTKLRAMGEEITLVVSGKKRDWANQHQVAVQSGLLIYLGSIPHDDAVYLSAGSCLDVNLSKVDSMPRASLEAVAAGAKVILPPGVPEFIRSCPESVATSNLSSEIALQAAKILHQSNYYLNYDMSIHDPGKVLLQYLSLFS